MKTNNRKLLRFFNIIYVVGLLAFLFYIVCSIIYKTKDGLLFVYVSMIVGTVSIVLLNKKLRKVDETSDKNKPLH